MLLGASNVNKDTERKRVLLSSNNDTITVNNDLSSISNLSEFSFSINWSTQNTGQAQQVLSINGVNAGNWLSLEQSSIGDVYFLVRDSSNVQAFSRLIIAGMNINQVYEIEFNGSQVYLDGVLKYTVSSPETILLDWANQTTELNTYVGGRKGDQTYEEFNLNGESFSCNEGNGVDVVGSNGTVATVNTSHAGGLNYINQEVIKTIYGSGKQRKRVFDWANSDKLKILDMTVPSGSEIYVKWQIGSDAWRGVSNEYLWNFENNTVRIQFLNNSGNPATAGLTSIIYKKDGVIIPSNTDFSLDLGAVFEMTAETTTDLTLQDFNFNGTQVGVGKLLPWTYLS